MPYKALRPCRFDKVYLTGDIIADDVIDPVRVRNLVEEQKLVMKIESEMVGSQSEENDKYTFDGEIKQQASYSKSKLSQMVKSELLELASKLHLPVNAYSTNAQIAEAILLTQESTEDEKAGD